jgi:protein-disulfide isomerase
MLEGSVSRRATVSLISVVALVAVGLTVNRTIRPALAARYNRSPQPSGTGHSPLAVAEAASARPDYASSGSSKLAEPSSAVPSAPEPIPSAPQPVPAQTPAGLSDVDPHKALGSKSAPIAIEVFSDFQCPACKQLYSTTMKQVVENYVNTGKVYLVHRDFPLPMHAYSRIAARYGVAGARIGKFEPVERILFEKQEVWEQSGDVDGTVAGVLTAADMAKVRALVKGGTLEDEINKDYAMGQTYQVNMTPTSIIHYKGQTYPVVGQQTYPIFHDFLDQLLSMK